MPFKISSGAGKTLRSALKSFALSIWMIDVVIFGRRFPRLRKNDFSRSIFIRAQTSERDDGQKVADVSRRGILVGMKARNFSNSA